MRRACRSASPLDAPVSTLAAGEKQKLEILKQLYLEQPHPHPRRADLGADAATRPTRCSGCCAAWRERRRADRPDDHAQVPRGHGASPTRSRCCAAAAGRRRQGRVDLTTDAMARMMIGDAAAAASAPARRRASSARCVLEIDGTAALDDDDGMPALRRGLDLQVSAGEIVGIAGVSGNGQRELVEVLAGQRAARAAARSSISRGAFDADARRDSPASSCSACRRSRCRTPASRA